jgi:glycosyltransferase involved in cell wall biosynthesis
MATATISVKISKDISERLSESINKDNKFVDFIPAIEPKEISIIIPVKNNQIGIDRFLKLFFLTQKKEFFPREIIIIDNNSSVPVNVSKNFIGLGIDIRVLTCRKKGPAAARNLGIRNSIGQWLLFCDSDCIPTNSLIIGYLQNNIKAIAFTGNVEPETDTWLDNFYNRERVLLPRMKPNTMAELVPLYIITANALVWKAAIIKCGYFNESFTKAGGEDVELSIRLWKIGNIAAVPESLVLHDFGNGFKDFYKRFINYGKGNRELESITKINMKARFQKPKQSTFLDYFMKFLLYAFISIGYYIKQSELDTNDV